MNLTVKEFKIQLALGSISQVMKEALVDYNSGSTFKGILTILSNDKDWVIRAGVALHENTPIRILKKLSKDSEDQVRYWVACNPNTSIKVLEKLSKDACPAVYQCASDFLKEELNK